MSEPANQYSEKTGEPARFVIYPGDSGTEAYHDKYVDHLEAEVERLRGVIVQAADEIEEEINTTGGDRWADRIRKQAEGEGDRGRKITKT